MSEPHIPNPQWQSRAFLQWDGVERFQPLIHFPPNVYKLYLFKGPFTYYVIAGELDRGFA